MPVTQPSPSHAQHDALLIAKLAANDMNSPERVRAMALIAECSACADLLQDLQAIQLATRALPAPVRRRDFRLTEIDSAALRKPAWRAWLERLAGPRFEFTQRVGTGLAALGIAGLLFASLPGFLLTGSVSTILSTAGAPVGASRGAIATNQVAPTAPTAPTAKSGAAAPVQPPASSGSDASSESVAGDQSAAPSAAAGAAAIPAPTTAPTAPSNFGPSAPSTDGTFSALAGASPSTGPAAGAPNPAGQAPIATAGSRQSDGAAAGPTAPPAPAASPAAAPQATGASRGVPQGVTTDRTADGSGSGLRLSPLALVSIALFLLGLGLLLARRMAVGLTSR